MKNKKIIHLGISSFNTKGRGLQKQGTKAFTLVELIVVITILAILGTIAFISFQGYSRDARDAQRMTDLGNMKKVLSLYITTNGNYPMPTEEEEIKDEDNETVWYQGTFGDSVRAKLGNRANLSDTPYDPLTYNEYTYSITSNKNEYDIAVVFETEQAYNSVLKNLNKAQAAGAYGFTKVDGDYNGKILKKGNCNSLKIYAVPSIIKANTGSTDLKTILEGKQLVYNNSKLLPSSYSGATAFTQKLPTKDIVNTNFLQVFTGTCDELKDETIQQEFINKLVLAYSGTAVEDDSRVGPTIEQPTLYTAQTIIHNFVDTNIEITAEPTSTGTGTVTAGLDLTGKCAINQDPNVTVTFDDTYKDDTSIYGTGFYIQSNTCLKWQAQTGPYGLKWASGSTDSGDDNYYANYDEPVWDGNHYTYNPPNGGVDTDYQAFKYCESIGDGWRLPTKKELFSIMTYESGDKNSSQKYTRLPSITQTFYWSSTAYASHSSTAWNGYFNSGGVGYSYKYNTIRYTICVHD